MCAVVELPCPTCARLITCPSKERLDDDEREANSLASVLRLGETRGMCDRAETVHPC